MDGEETGVPPVQGKHPMPTTEGSQTLGLAKSQWGQNCSLREGGPREEGAIGEKCGEPTGCGTITKRRF